MKNSLFLSLALMSTAVSAQTPPTPPDVAKKPHVVKAPFGAERQDKAMLGYLGAENAYADALLAPLKPVQDKLYDEIVARIKQDDASVPFRERGWWYYSRFEAGKDYPIHARRKDAA
ncbi:MAG: S9 family peptidase, partial [Stenotrophomonas sp.]